MWSVIRSVTGKQINNAGIQFLNIEGKLTDNQHMITNFVNKYFLTVAGKITSNNINVNNIAE
jgi:hypothetical protein